MRISRRAGWFAAIVAAVLAGGASDAFAGGSKGGSTTGSTGSGTEGGTYGGGSTGVQKGSVGVVQVANDNEIAGILKVANDIDIKAAEYVRDRTKDANVKRFAEQMITDHTGANNTGDEVFKRANVNVADSAVSKQLKDDADRFMTDLKNQTGANLDRVYIDHEIMFHQQVLDTIDNQLLPNAKDPTVRSHINNLRPTFKAHLDHANQVRNQLGKTGPA